MRNVIVVMGLGEIRPGAHAAVGLEGEQHAIVLRANRGQLGLNIITGS